MEALCQLSYSPEWGQRTIPITSASRQRIRLASRCSGRRGRGARSRRSGGSRRGTRARRRRRSRSAPTAARCTPSTHRGERPVASRDCFSISSTSVRTSRRLEALTSTKNSVIASTSPTSSTRTSTPCSRRRCGRRHGPVRARRGRSSPRSFVGDGVVRSCRVVNVDGRSPARRRTCRGSCDRARRRRRRPRSARSPASTSISPKTSG